MKNILLIFSAFIVLLSCNSDDDGATAVITQVIEPEVQILGQWKLISVYHYDPEMIIDYSNEEIIFNFNSNNLLVISGNDDPAYVYINGEYEYNFNILPAIGPNGNPRPRLEIGNSSWGYLFNYNDIDLILTQVDWDGPVWYFEKK